MKTVLAAFAMCVAMSQLPALAHGAPVPSHGGQILAVGETWLELVVRGNTLELYVQDDGDDVASAALSGKLTILNGGSKSESALKPAGGNKLEATAAVASGAKVLALLVLADKKTKVSTTFVIK